MDHMFDHRTSLNKFKKTEMVPSIIFWPQQQEIINQLQEENWKKYKHTESNPSK